MDWKAIMEKGNALKDQALDKTFAALEKTTGHTYEGLKNTPISIKTGTELDEARNANLSVVFVVGKEDAASKAVLVRMPLLLKDAWIVSANLKVLLSEEVPELLSALDLSEVPAVLVYRKGTLEKRLLNENAVAFAKNFDVSKPKEAAVANEVPEGKTDVIAETVAPAPVPLESIMESAPETK
jgi:hypothetical protein